MTTSDELTELIQDFAADLAGSLRSGSMGDLAGYATGRFGTAGSRERAASRTV